MTRRIAWILLIVFAVGLLPVCGAQSTFIADGAAGERYITTNGPIAGRYTRADGEKGTAEFELRITADGICVRIAAADGSVCNTGDIRAGFDAVLARADRTRTDIGAYIEPGEDMLRIREQYYTEVLDALRSGTAGLLFTTPGTGTGYTFILAGCEGLWELFCREFLDAPYALACSYAGAGDFAAAVEIFESLAVYGYEGAADGAKEAHYRYAQALRAEEKYTEAVAEYTAIPGYKDVNTILREDDALALALTTRKAVWQVGNTVTMGHYEQDGNAENGAEDIEWIVLARDDRYALLISRYGLDAAVYNERMTAAAWESCSLRGRLNGEFLQTAFSAAERTRICFSNVPADANPDWTTPQGGDTQDRVFLLSIAEAKRYFADDRARACAPTAAAVENGVYLNEKYEADGSGACWWWLRTCGCDSELAAGINMDGSVYSGGNCVDYADGALRPVIRVRMF